MRDHKMTERPVMHWVAVVDEQRPHPHGGTLDRRRPGDGTRAQAPRSLSAAFGAVREPRSLPGPRLSCVRDRS